MNVIILNIASQFLRPKDSIKLLRLSKYYRINLKMIPFMN